MKKITFLTFLMTLLTVMFGFSQVVLQDFESGGLTGVFGGAAASIVADPEVGGTNGNVAMLTASSAGQFFQGTNIGLSQSVELTTDKTMTIDVYSLEPISIAPKVINPLDGGPESTAAVTHTGSGWETLTITFNEGLDNTATANGLYGAFVIYYNWDTSTNNFINPPIDRVFYVDNITGIPAPPTCNDGVQNQDETGVDCGGASCPSCPEPPSAAPTTPPNRAPEDVISVYSNAYTQAPTDGFQVFGGAVVSEIDYSGNTVQVFTTPDNGSGLQYQYFGVTPQFLDLSAMTNAHLDFYFSGAPSAVGTILIFIVQYSDGTNIQKNFDVTSLTPNTWYEMDMAFTDFDANAGNARDQIQQVIVQVAGADGSATGPVYFDNLYFHNNQVLSTNEFDLNDFTVSPNPTNNVWNVRTNNQEITSISVFDILGKEVVRLAPNNTEASINASQLNDGIYLAKISSSNGTKTVKLVKN